MDGLEATRQLRQLPLALQPFVIAMTANAFAEDREACFAAGMNHFVSKPVKFDTLREALAKALSHAA
jgi:CheY-like chemotaxis protein